MEMIWKYVIGLTNKNVFDDFQKRYNVEVPTDIQQLVTKANAGTPSKMKIKDDGEKERVLGAVLSYNESDDDNVYTAMEVEHNKKYIPFAIDPFGNYFYENTLFGEILFIDHETGEISRIADSLEFMLKNLY